MTRHITNKPRATHNATRLREYLRICRAALPHRSSLVLQRRARESISLGRFLTIARARTD